MPFGKSRATGYSDYYKNKDKTPGYGEDDEEPQYSVRISMSAPKRPGMKEDEEKDPRKIALKRRLQKLREGK